LEDERELVRSAKIELCDSERMMDRQGRYFWATQEITCEGSGLIRLTYRDGSTHDCIVGYVTPGAHQNFTYQATNSGCR
jgi:hypothetical protein